MVVYDTAITRQLKKTLKILSATQKSLKVSLNFKFHQLQDATQTHIDELASRLNLGHTEL